ncbi:hypothetical protein ABMC89_01835 [Sulfitobacter sp. HNIBRBA3233]|uniref:hypothetical protein n=1 Tax=Sulfitobacter marinivivus TaxID=3158558 RepID=UPI0032DF40F7
MLQIMTGPMGCLAYLDARSMAGAAYPALNVPSCDFASGEGVVAANDIAAPGVVSLPRHTRKGAARAMFGEPVKRES